MNIIQTNSVSADAKNSCKLQTHGSPFWHSHIWLLNEVNWHNLQNGTKSWLNIPAFTFAASSLNHTMPELKVCIQNVRTGRVKLAKRAQKHGTLWFVHL